MARPLRVLALVTAAVLAAVIFFVVVTLPPAPERLGAAGDADLVRRTIPGAFHVHTTRSDGTLDKRAVASAAARAGLRFAIFTDHGDGTRPPDPPEYLDGVLCLDGVEISTIAGHYLAMDMQASPYPLGGAGWSVVEDVARLGGFGVAAHPDSPKPALQWRDDDAPVDGLEWLSADSEWRDESRTRLARALASYLVRPGSAMASLLDRPVATLARWDSMARRRPVVALAGHDAHGGIGGAVEDERRWLPRIPSYEAAFRSMSNRVLLERPLTGDAAVDARLILGAVRRGRVFTAIDAVARPAAVDFRLRLDDRELAMGDSAWAASAVATVTATVPGDAATVLIRDGTDIASSAGGRLEHRVSGPGVYRVEVRAPRAPGSPPVPWLVTNPIYLRDRAATPAPVPALPTVVLPLDGASWHVEHDPASRGTLSSGGDGLRLEYTLQAGERASQFVALAAELPADVPPFTTIAFTGRAAAPMRVSVQLRFRDQGSERWVRSVYLSPEVSARQVRFADMRPADERASPRPDPRTATAVLFVVDLTNAAPGASGWFSIARPTLAKE